MDKYNTSILANNDISSIIFALSSIATGFIAWKCCTPPNPKPAHAERDDLLFNQNFLAVISNSGIYVWSYVFILMGFLAAFLCVTWDGDGDVFSTYQHQHQYQHGVGGPVGISRSLCPNYGNLDGRYVKPSAYSVGCLVVAIAFGVMRIVAFGQLGRNFTFQLAKPSQLYTEGLYRYVQHPSYTGALVMITAIFLLWVQPQGVLGCFIPVGVAESAWLFWGLRGMFLGGLLWTMAGRVRQEERMMKREFGRVWVEYHGRTARFIPGVF